MTAARARAHARPDIVAVIPVSGQDAEFRRGLPTIAGQSLIAFTFDAALSARRLTRVVVSTDDRRIATAARAAGISDVVVRGKATRRQPLARVLDDAVQRLERADAGFRPRWVVRLQVTYPFRDHALIDDAIESVLSQDLDSAFMAFPEYDTFWDLQDRAPQRITTDTTVPRARRRPIYREVGGLFSMVRRDVLAKGTLYGDRLGILPITSVTAALDLHGVHGRELLTLVAQSRQSRSQ